MYARGTVGFASEFRCFCCLFAWSRAMVALGGACPSTAVLVTHSMGSAAAATGLEGQAHREGFVDEAGAAEGGHERAVGVDVWLEAALPHLRDQRLGRIRLHRSPAVRLTTFISETASADSMRTEKREPLEVGVVAAGRNGAWEAGTSEPWAIACTASQREALDLTHSLLGAPQSLPRALDSFNHAANLQS